MIDPNNPKDFDDQPNERPDGDVPVEQEPLEVEPPRRAASAQFVVDADVGSEAALREAMDPANQSLAEALRLSFRLLQIVILVLIVLFFMSGFQTVGEGQSGVLTRWGKIVPVAGQEALEPGLRFSYWPYPAGEFVVFDAENRSVSVRDAFMPDLGNHRTLEAATDAARVQDPIRPESSGYVLTRDGDIAHMRLSARYNVENPVDFVRRVSDAEADRLVRLALQRATVQVAAQITLQDVIDLSDEIRHTIRESAQQILDSTGCGIQLASVDISDAMPALAIRATFGEVQSAQVEAEQRIEHARQEANERLVFAVGERYRDLMRLINRYEDALQTDEDARADSLLAEINLMLDSERVSGEVAQIMHRAHAYRAQIESTLGNEARRFASLLPTFRQYPDMVVRQRWLQAYGNVLRKPDAEVFFVPRELGSWQMVLSGSHEIREMRQRMDLDRREAETYQRSLEGRRGLYLPWAEDMQLEGPGRQLRIEGDRVAPRRQPGRTP